MSNLFWYICLAIIGVGMTAYSIYMKRDTYKVSTLMVFYFFAAGTTWIGEFTVLGLFNSYGYKTGVFESPWAQNILGHLILNTTLYPAVAIVLVAFSLSYGWISIVTAFFILMEYLFMKLGIYEQHWWRYYMTAITAVTFLLICKYWFPKMLKKPYGVTRVLTYYFVAMLIIHTPAPILLLLGKLRYHLDFVYNMLGDLYLSSTIIIFFYHLVESLIMVLFTCVLKKWYWKVVPFVISITVQSLLAKANILVFNEGWNLAYTLLIYEIFIAVFILIEKFTLKPATYSYFH